MEKKKVPLTFTIDFFEDYINQYSPLVVDGYYCKLYELRLKDLIAYNRQCKEQETRLIKDQSINNCLSEEQLYKEYINHGRGERTKFQSQEILINNYKKQSNNTSLKTNRIITSNNIPTLIEHRSKCTLKTKLPPISTKHQRIISAPISYRKNRNKIPTIPIDYPDETLSKANNHSFTQVTSSSSSSQNDQNKRHKHARQSILETIMTHLDSYKSANISNRSTYETIEHKFSSSFAPNVYQNFERIVVQEKKSMNCAL
ncbi:unnamed protein product [Rotaria sordida]|uniref:Uncharacterized protein n=1 Tax=Rotaria sordida TaxID=392033 RepID=A0A815HYU3_9BILA|nr:unnamed protein product [Rotaria sordida]CAF1358847.1 unnamed protein product [Rotaria sordida]